MFARDLAATATACMTANAITHPLEMLKTRQMLDSRGRGVGAVARSVVMTEGVRALWKGITPALARGAVSGGGRLAGYNALKAQAERRGMLGKTGDGTAAAEIVLRAAMAVTSASVSQLAAAPFDLARTRQTMCTGTPPALPAVIREVVALRGVVGLFTGVVPLLGRTVLFNISQLLTYDAAKERTMALLGTRGSDDPADHVLAAGPASMAAGFAATMASCPAENVKTVMQAETTQSTGRGLAGTVAWITRTQGVAAFWRGWVPLYLKLGPHTLIVFVLSEKCRGMLGVRSV